MAGEYRSGERVSAGQPQHLRARAGQECFVVVLSSWSFRDEDDCFERRVHFSRFDEALIAAQRHVRRDDSGRERQARVWYQERLLLWESEEQQYASWKYCGPDAVGLYRVKVGEPAERLHYDLVCNFADEAVRAAA